LVLAKDKVTHCIVVHRHVWK